MDISGGVTAPRDTNIESLPLFITIIGICLVVYGLIALFSNKNKQNNHEEKEGTQKRKLQCKICESQNLIKENEYIVCQECGCKYSIDEAKDLLKGS